MISEKIYLYEDRQDVYLTTYIWDNSRELGTGPNMKRPAILICPGGGYISCSDREAEPVALRFAAMGYNAFVLRYSTYSKGMPFGMSPDMTVVPQPETNHPVPVREIGMAILMMHEKAKKWRIDTDRIALCGFSAGAHNAALYATSWHRPVIAEYFDTDINNLRPAAVILGYPVTDFKFMRGFNHKDPMLSALMKNMDAAFLGTDSPSDELLIEASPARLVDENTPPMFIWATSNDELVPVNNSLLMAQALSEHDIPYTLHIFEDGFHGLSVATQASSCSKIEISDEIGSWVKMAEDWLYKRFSLPLVEMTPMEENVLKMRKENK